MDRKTTITNLVGWLMLPLVFGQLMAPVRSEMSMNDGCSLEFTEEHLENCTAQYGSDCQLTELNNCLQESSGSCHSLCSLTHRKMFVYQIKREASCTISVGQYDFCLRLTESDCLDKLDQLLSLTNETSTEDICSELTAQMTCLTRILQGPLDFYGTPIPDNACQQYNLTVIDFINRISLHSDLYCASNSTDEICPNGADFGPNAINSNANTTTSQRPQTTTPHASSSPLLARSYLLIIALISTRTVYHRII